VKIIVLKVHTPTIGRIDYVKEGFYEKVEFVPNKFPKNHIKILL
jgi:hypothetical protein